ncbi:lactonase family protein [Mucilaginibacter agri]|uniref:Beta-propeller fold lactonase family protein n=1 Tax=Mucilaginibacter agri TaxID=2695265 RepID=A0A966DRS0_9SPHI|nr:lactonase family protein [Mucilaginibacter agri]NCD68785.1 beta-propeller fold lactonase family protein [Mucilaginibacter agri]
MKKLLFIALLLVSGLTYAQKQKPLAKTYDLVIGTYTKGEGKGIYVYRFYTETGKLAYLSQVATSNPSYLCVSSNNKFVYAVNEDGKDGGVSSFSFDAKTGVLQAINKQSSQGADPCYISVDKAQKNVFVANYSSGNLSVLPVNADGSLGAVKQNIKDEGHGPNAGRQEGPHVHTAVLSPDEKYVYYSDLGTDKFNTMRYKPSAEQPLTAVPENVVNVMPGNGPRHIDFTPDHKYAYLITEMAGAVYGYEYKGGKFKQIQSITMLPDGFTGDIGAADIHVSPDGLFLYASNRGTANDITTYAINQENGQLTFVDRVSTQGKGPRNFVIDPTGSFLLAANQNSDFILVYKIDKTTGKLTPTGVRLNIGNPVCLKFTPAQ